MENNIKSKYRALFFYSFSACCGWNIELNEDFFRLLFEYVQYLMRNADYDDKCLNRLKNIDLIVYFKKGNDNNLEAFETEGTIEDVLKESINFDMGQNMLKLYNDIGQDKVDIITDLANDFYNYFKTMYLDSIPEMKQ